MSVNVRSLFTSHKTASVSEQLAELHAQNEILRADVARISRELAALKARPLALTVERKGCALIADRLGINERTVRHTLVNHAKFAPVRDRLARENTVITRSAPFLAFLADNLETAWPR